MTDSNPPAQPQPAQQQQQVQIPVDAANRETVYTNFVQAHLNADELHLDLGTFSQVVTPTGAEPIQLSHRVIMNFATAKRLADLLRRAVAQHEQMFGVIEVDPNRRLRVPPRPPGA
ncbi:MAG: DUF3467 domain-containing protein [Gemmataceae bacterium]|nr:DUF3467 domain-containing protein [Gemmataceae bacterium]